MLYPIKFTSVYKSKIWGGSKLREIYSRQIPTSDIGEAWEVSCREDGMSVVANGSLQGMPFSRLMETYGTAITGEGHYDKGFPLLLKLLDVNSDLSVQVHPTAEYIKKNSLEGEEEKNEMWYVLNAEDNATMISGVKPGITKERLRAAIEEGKLEACLERSPVKTGDVILIKTGSVHAACSGMLLFELQQSSDTTYRLYDYGRKDSNGMERRLDVDKALGTVNLDRGVEFIQKPDYAVRNDFMWRRLLKTKEFTLDELKINHDGLYRCKNNKSFGIYTSISGSGIIRSNGVSAEIGEGESVFIPTCLEKYVITGNCTLLFSSVKPPVSFS